MVALVLIGVLAWQFYIGYTRGIILQAYYAVASVLSLGIAGYYYLKVATVLTLWIPYSSATEGASVSFFSDVDILSLAQVFYAGFAYTLIFLVSYWLFRLLGIAVHLAPVHRYDSQVTKSVSGGLSILVTLLMISMVCTVLATISLTSVQTFLSSHWTLSALITKFPLVSQLWHSLWTAGLS